MRHFLRTNLTIATIALSSQWYCPAFAQDKASTAPTADATTKTTTTATASTEPVNIPDPTLPFDYLGKLQETAIKDLTATWGHWGNRPSSYSAWTNHSNRLIPVYVFGDSFAPYMNEGSVYRDAAAIEKLYGRLPPNTHNPNATYGDQTDVYRLQRKAIESGKKYVFLVVFDGMDWQTTQAAAIYKSKAVKYNSGRGTGLLFQDYDRCKTDFGYYANSAYGDEVETDVNAQINIKPITKFGGYDSRLGGNTPWDKESDIEYLIGRSKISEHAYTDSSSSATSLTAGVKALNGAVNLNYEMKPVETVARWAQRVHKFSVGAVTSVPISHATPAAAYAQNVSRDDYQDLTRDLLGLPSVARKTNPDPGLDVLIGAGIGEETKDGAGQGANFIPGNRYLTDEDLQRIDFESGNPGASYIVAKRTPGKKGNDTLTEAAAKAIAKHKRLLGFFGVKNGHLPFQTADGDYFPSSGIKSRETYSPADLAENPKLADCTRAAISVLETNSNGFWLMVESGDVDWANHSNNIDNSIGAVLSGEDAIGAIFDWIESHNAWNESLVVVTADHGHFFHLVEPEALIPK